MVSLVHASVHGRLGSIKTLFHLVNYPLYSFTEWDPIVSMPTEVSAVSFCPHISVILLHCCPAMLFFSLSMFPSHGPQSPLVEMEIL